MEDFIERLLLNTKFDIQPPCMSVTHSGQDLKDYRFDDYDFWYVKDGACRIVHNGSRSEIHAKTMRIYRPGDTLSVLHRKDPLTVYLCHFKPSDALFHAAVVLPHALSLRDRYIEHEFERAIDAETKGYRLLSRDHFIRAVLLYLLSHDLIDASAAAVDRRTQERFTVFLSLTHHIGTRLAERLSIGDLSAFAGIDRTTVIKLFSEFAQMTPHRYILARRIEAAKHRLTAGVAVGDVPVETGFSDASVFSKVFKKHTGMTPGTYRTLQREKSIV